MTADTQSIKHGGTTLYLCSKDCANRAGKLSEGDWDAAIADSKARFAATEFFSHARMKEGRSETEFALLPAAKNEIHPSVDVIYRGAGGSGTAVSTVSGSEGR